ncbi:tetraacyldisaccharide 4'-kinase [Pararhodospirillum oryzae]|uniref:Tetraacyldisaccharide 4'-kinase n=1 Tax=Pararhodospirillum oryzae TaxID=478448 RepID=A0A512H8F9_9PROT|nr:tetraacyldisaccharide 4'-kinase [Pararhodospirillum oryzae]GEO81708.1 tetraacyldisaccharide 4'-kinase [Pararhodospirillum oryzae]
MRTPEFWASDAFPARLLEPLGYLYAAATRRRLARGRPVDPGVPVLCVGNLTAGGAGKTPLAQAVMTVVRGLGVEGHFLSRGYGGRLKGPVAIDPIRHGADEVGDEPLLLADMAPCWVARDRAAGARAAVAAGAGALVMDDGHQNPGLRKALSLVVVDGGFGFGNRRILPAGPLREPIRVGLARADAVVRIGPDRTGADAWIPEGLPCLGARLEPGPSAARLVGRRVVAFAGIGRPAKFFESLHALGAEVVAAHPFADHYPYAETDIQPILDEAWSLDAVPVTTAKDAMRLPPDQRPQVDVVGVRVAFDDPAAFHALIQGALAGRLPPAQDLPLPCPPSS